MTPAARSRVALAALALSAYAACADQPASPQHTVWHDGPKPEARDAADPTHGLDQHLDDIRIRLTHRHERATRGQARRSNVTPPQGGDLPPEPTGDVRNVTSTAYCLTGTMANGQRVHYGAVAMNGVPLGSVWQVDGGGGTYTVADRIGSGSQFDIAMPGDCAAARAYGRRVITVRRVA